MEHIRIDSKQKPSKEKKKKSRKWDHNAHALPGHREQRERFNLDRYVYSRS